MRLYVIRHGQTTMNVGQGGGANCLLTAIGKWQAEQIVQFFKNIHVDAIYTSPLDRSIMTSIPLASDKQLPLTLVPEMSEMFLTEWSYYRDYPWDSCRRLLERIPNSKWIASHDQAKPWWPAWPEDKGLVRKRVQVFYDKHIAPLWGTDANIVVFGHGQSTADLKQLANPGDTIPVYNGGVVEFLLNASGSCESAKVHTEHLGPYVSD
ncbi:phosphoglycerate mutase [Paenibacillus riograndensis]|uniref:Phosphoglycerate mutase n=1 Tax=Paenibacillus riograndensis TaxID=483937 RepID=A0A132TX18_9BACL|nr:phosphoglycerate mutase family protein [Paenibacillus riograndensis]KWX75897.1 phosphoglycerate mutase [Paenibacillus riograndensis]